MTSEVTFDSRGNSVLRRSLNSRSRTSDVRQASLTHFLRRVSLFLFLAPSPSLPSPSLPLSLSLCLSLSLYLSHSLGSGAHLDYKVGRPRLPIQVRVRLPDLHCT